jgi:hypothetical protein
MATQPETMFETADDQAVDEMDRQAKLREAMTGVIGRLGKLADERVSDRSPIEQRWLLDIRQYHGRLDPATEAAIKASPEKSRAIINMTGPRRGPGRRAWATSCSRPTTRIGASARRRSPSSPSAPSKPPRRPRPSMPKPRAWSTSTTAMSRPAPRPCRPARRWRRPRELGEPSARLRGGRAEGPRRDGRRQARV